MNSPKNSSNTRQIIFKVLEDNTLLETIRDEGSNRLQIVVCKSGEKPFISDNYHDRSSGMTYEPINAEVATNHKINFPTDILFGITADEVRSAFIETSKKYLDVSEIDRNLMAFYFCHTSIFDKFPSTPYLNIRGMMSSGKTTALSLFQAFGIHMVPIGSGITHANIYSTLGKFPSSTLLLDECNLYDTSARSVFTQVLNSGYSRDGAVIRTIKSNFCNVVFPTFGCKIIANNSDFSEPSLASRMFSINMVESDGMGINFFLPDTKTWEEAKELRNLSLGFRLAHFHQKPVGHRYEELKGLISRLQEITTVVLHGQGCDQVPELILKKVQEQNAMLKDKQNNTPEAMVARAILDEYSPAKSFIQAKKIVSRVYQNERYNIRPGELRNVIAIFELQPGRNNGGVIYTIQKDQFDWLYKKYGVTET